MLSEPPTWLGGYSLKVWRKPPTRVTAGTMVHSFSPHQRAYIIDWSGYFSHGSCRRLVTRGTLVDSSVPVNRLPLMVLKLSFQSLYRTAVRSPLSVKWKNSFRGPSATSPLKNGRKL